MRMRWVILAGVATLTWLAPGDDENVGRASVYCMRYSASGPITEENWANAQTVFGMPLPDSAGVKQSVKVQGLVVGQVYWFAIRAADEAWNWSGLSNVVRKRAIPKHSRDTKVEL